MSRSTRSNMCPHLPEEGCRCRKPAPGLFEQAVADFASCRLPPSWSAINNAMSTSAEPWAATSFLFLTGYGAETGQDAQVHPDFTVPELRAVAAHIASQDARGINARIRTRSSSGKSASL